MWRARTRRRSHPTWRDSRWRCRGRSVRRPRRGSGSSASVSCEALWSAVAGATALGGRRNRDGTQRVMLAPSSRCHRPPPSQSGGSVATALQSFAKCAVSRARTIGAHSSHPLRLREATRLLRFEPSMLHFEPSTLRFEPSIIRFESSMLRFEPSMLRFEPSMLHFEPSMVCFEASMLCLEASMVCFEAWMVCF